MIEEPKTLTIAKDLQRPSDAQIAAFRDVPTGFVVDAMFGDGALPPSIAPLGFGRDLICRAAGPALSVGNAPGDVLALFVALKFVRPGDIVMNSFGGHQACAAAGDRVTGMLKNCGAAGFVTDGPMRDYEGIVEVGLPTWCTGLTPGSPFATGPGKIGLPITLAGHPVETGDMVVADRDGVVVVPFERIDSVIANLKDVATSEAALDAQVAEGLKIPPAFEEMLEGDAVNWV